MVYFDVHFLPIFFINDNISVIMDTESKIKLLKRTHSESDLMDCGQSLKKSRIENQFLSKECEVDNPSRHLKQQSSELKLNSTPLISEDEILDDDVLDRCEIATVEFANAVKNKESGLTNIR